MSSSKLQFFDKIQALQSLPKIHYTWGMWYQFEDYDESVLYQLARINHSLSIKGEWVTESQIEKSIYACAKANMLKPAIPSSIGINYSPWHREFDKDAPPTDRGPKYYAEISLFEKRLTQIKYWVDKYNKKYKSDVKVGAILLDCERFFVKVGNDLWNNAMREALDVIHLKAKKIYPDARIEWYGRGFSKGAGKRGWNITPYWTGKEIKPTLSCALYCVPEQEKMRETFRRTVELADKLDVKQVTPWVALASGYRPGLIKPLYWDQDWDYDLIYSYQLGAELNIKSHSNLSELYAPYERAEVVVFFPAPFERDYPEWEKHFIAYVRGATGVSDLKDLGYNN